MSPEDRARFKSDQQRIERTRERNQDALQMSREKLDKFTRTLANSGAEIRRARRELRKYGYLK